MPEKVTSLNGLKVILEYCSHISVRITKIMLNLDILLIIINMLITVLFTIPILVLLWELEKQRPWLGLRYLKAMVNIKVFCFFT